MPQLAWRHYQLIYFTTVQKKKIGAVDHNVGGAARCLELALISESDFLFLFLFFLITAASCDQTLEPQHRTRPNSGGLLGQGATWGGATTGS